MATCPTCRTHYPDDVATCSADGARLLRDEVFASADTDLKSGDVVGEYRVEVKLGEGGFGTVYRAQHPLIGKKAAIKVLAREYSSKPEIVARFIDEARAVNQIRHRGIIDIFAFGTLADGRQYFVMELLEGEPLEAYLRRRGRLVPAEAIPILRSVARAVDAAHAQGIAHRDLKPDNVFLVEDDEYTIQPKLLDFGVAKLLGERSGQKTQTGTPIGTPHYMSPEQSRGVNVDTRTDVYSFGVMAYQMLTGVLPFDGEAVMDILLKQISEVAKPPSTVCPELPVALDAPIAHMLAKEPAARPPTLGAAVEELAEAASRAGIMVPASAAIIPLSQPALATARTVASTPGTLVGSSTELAPVARRTPRALLVVVAAAMALLASVGAFVMATKSTSRAKVPSSASLSGAPEAIGSHTIPSETASSATPEQIDVTIDSTPAHADIFRGNDKLGVAPGPIRLPKGHGTIALTFKSPNRVPRDVEIDTSASSVVSVVLEAQPQTGGAATTKTPKPPASHKATSEIETPTF